MVIPIPFILAERHMISKKHILYFDEFDILMSRIVSLLKKIGYLKLSLKLLIASSSIFYSCSLGLFMSTLFYISSICGIVLMYPFYAQRLSCTLNIFFITWTAILLIVMMVVSLHSKVCP